MTQESFEAKQAAMTNKELIELVEKQISDLAGSGGRSHRMCVPPMITDTDMLLSEMVRRFKRYSQSIGFAYMPTIVDEMGKNPLNLLFNCKTTVDDLENRHNIDGCKAMFDRNFPEDKGLEKREAMKSVKKNPLFELPPNWDNADLDDVPADWMPEVFHEYWTICNGEICRAVRIRIQRPAKIRFPTQRLAQMYLESLQEKSKEL